MIEIRHLRKSYESETPLTDVNAVVNRGDIVVVIGPSGTGKSTLLRCINGLEKASGGEILLNGKNILARGVDQNRLRRKVGMVFQSFNLFEHLNVAENVMLGPHRLEGFSREQAYARAAELLESVGMAGKLLAYPEELSGGQKQRVAIARAMAMDPDILLLDEPTSALDPTMVGEVKSVIFGLAKRGLTMIIVTHDMSFAREIATRVFYMDQGGICEEGTPEQIFDHPQKESTRRFMQKLRVLQRTVDNRRSECIRLLDEARTFGLQILLPSEQHYHLQSAVEEICVQKLLPHADQADRLELSVNYDADTRRTDVRIAYSGPRFNPFFLSDDSDVSQLMIRNAVRDLDYTYDESAGLPNVLTMVLR